MSGCIIYPQDKKFADSVPQREGITTTIDTALNTAVTRLYSMKTIRKGLQVSILKEDHNSHMLFSEFPVENGFPITDHMRKKQPEFPFTFAVSQDPALLLGGGGIEKLITIGSNLVTGKTNPLELQSYPRDIWIWLNKLMDAGALIDILTTLDMYKDMVISDIAAPMANKNYVEFTITTKKMYFVDAQTADAIKPEPESSTDKKKSNATPQGKVDPKVTTPAQADAVNESWAAQLIGL